MKTTLFIHYNSVSVNSISLFIHLTENIGKNLDKGNIGCNIVNDL